MTGQAEDRGIRVFICVCVFSPTDLEAPEVGSVFYTEKIGRSTTGMLYSKESVVQRCELYSLKGLCLRPEQSQTRGKGN